MDNKNLTAEQKTEIEVFDKWTNRVAMGVGRFFPKAAIAWTRNRNALASYAASSRTGPNKAWLPTNKSADQIIKTEQPLLRARARSLVRDSSQVAGALKKITNNAVFKGIRPQAKIKNGDELNDELNNTVEAAFTAWADAVNFHEVENLILRHWWSDGELFVHYYLDQELKDAGIIPLGIELLECDHLDTTMDMGVDETTVPGKKGVWKQGILYSAYKRPLGYQLFLEHPGSSTWWSTAFARNRPNSQPAQNTSATSLFSESRFYPASMTDHLYIKDRASQNRGLPWLTSILIEMRDYNEYQAYERIANRLAAAFGIFVTTPFAESVGPGAASPIGGDGKKMTVENIPNYLEPGRIQVIPEGMEVDVAKNERPGQTYEPYTKVSLKGASTGMNMSYEAFSNDYSDATYSSARSATLEERRGYQVQQLILLKHLHSQAWIRLWSMNKLSRTVQGMPDLIPVKWQVPGWPWIDPDKDSKAAERDIKNALTSRHEVIFERGKDYNETKEYLDQEAEDGFPLGGPETVEPLEVEINEDK